MADIITRLKVDASQHNSQLDKAKRSVQRYAQQGMSADNVVKGLIGTFGRYITAIGAATAAMTAFQKIIAGSQTTTDAYGRTMEASKRVTEGFFESISRGNFGSFINGLQDIVTNARNAYDALDALSTFNAFNSQEVAGFEARRAQYRANIRRGVNIEESKQGLTALEKEEAEYYKRASHLKRQAGYAKLAELTGSPAGSGWITPYFEMGAAGQAAAAKAAEELKKASFSGSTISATGLYQGNITGNYGPGGWKSQADLDRYNALLNYSQLSDEQLNEISGYFAEAESATAQRWGKVASDARLMNVGNTPSGGRKGGGAASLSAIALSAAATPSLMEQMASYGQTPEDALKNQLEKAMSQENSLDLSQMFMGDFDFESVSQQLMENTMANLDMTEEYVKGIDKAKVAWKSVASIIGNVGSAMQSVDNKGLNVAGILASAAANIMMGFAEASAHEGKGGVWYWIAATAAGLATAVSTVAAIKSAGKYAEGGTVGGSSYYGDRLIAHVNSGETILTAEQTRAAVGQIEGGGSVGNSYISGEQIVSVVNAYGRRTGRGEILR